VEEGESGQSLRGWRRKERERERERGEVFWKTREDELAEEDRIGVSRAKAETAR